MAKEVKVMQGNVINSEIFAETDFVVYFYYFIHDVLGENVEDVCSIDYDEETDFYAVKWINTGSEKIMSAYIKIWALKQYIYECWGENDE